jgi:hypothetical protein
MSAKLHMPDVAAEARALREQLRAHRRSTKRLLLLAGLAGVAAMTGIGVARASDGGCPNGLPSCFAPDAPAQAASANSNFEQLWNWTTKKIGPFGTSDVSISGTLSVAGPLTLGGHGNTPHACVVRTVSNAYERPCATNEIAVGGGGQCSIGFYVNDSAPWSTSAAAPPASGAEANAWHVSCYQNEGSPVHTQPTRTVAICCQR